MKRIFITVKNRFDDTHCYPNAPEEVAFLRNEHRHTFIIESMLEVFHEDRELEFYMVKDYIDSIIPELKAMLKSKSCENMCMFIIDKLQLRYNKHRYIEVSVSEDDMNKATVKIEKEA